MLRTCLGIIAILAATAAPRPVRVRMAVSGKTSQATADQVTAALHRGLYADSIILEAPANDTAGGRPRNRAVLLQIAIADDGGQVRVCMNLRDVLARSIAGPDSIRVSTAQLDSVLVAYGARYAKVLAQDRLPSIASRERCY